MVFLCLKALMKAKEDNKVHLMEGKWVLVLEKLF